MLYIKYAEYKKNYHKSQEMYNDIVNEKEQLLSLVQPKATNFDKESVSGGKRENPFDTYTNKIIEDRVEERLEEARNILRDRKVLLYDKEEELRKSKNWFDIVYVYKYLEGLRVEEIKYKMPYCKRSIYGILEKIKKNI